MLIYLQNPLNLPPGSLPVLWACKNGGGYVVALKFCNLCLFIVVLETEPRPASKLSFTSGFACTCPTRP
ncbi:hypothetical protein A2U01_0091632, partial [Trifolium medium]|nr:hypothetical protein [Trifolium medium]